MIVRISFLLTIAAASYFFSCSSGSVNEPDDKYDLITSKERKIFKSFCDCIEPVMPYVKRKALATDSLEIKALNDSIDAKVLTTGPCIRYINELNGGNLKDKKYSDQFVLYIREKHPDCSYYFLGIKSTDPLPKSK